MPGRVAAVLPQAISRFHAAGPEVELKLDTATRVEEMCRLPRNRCCMVWWFVLPSPLTPMPLGIGFHMAMRTIVTGPAWRPYGLVDFSNPPRIRLLARFYNSDPHRE